MNCNSCQSEIKEGLRFCPYCGVELKAIDCEPTTPLASLKPGAVPGPPIPQEGEPSSAQVDAKATPQEEQASMDESISPGDTGVVRRDIKISGQVAFSEGEEVHVEAISPNPDMPEFKYLVFSRRMKTKFQL